MLVMTICITCRTARQLVEQGLSVYRNHHNWLFFPARHDCSSITGNHEVYAHSFSVHKTYSTCVVHSLDDLSLLISHQVCIFCKVNSMSQEQARGIAVNSHKALPC